MDDSQLRVKIMQAYKASNINNPAGLHRADEVYLNLLFRTTSELKAIATQCNIPLS